MSDKNENDVTKKPNDDAVAPTKKCPVNETWRHALYLGGMVALHAGVGATAMVADKSHKCPVSEWARHAVYTGGVVALLAMVTTHSSGSNNKAALDDKPAPAAGPTEEKKWYEVCPLNEWAKHAVYVVGMVGAVALVNHRKK